MPSARKILIADPDPTTLRSLGPALRQRGYQVHAARDGSRALQLAILRFPDLILFDERSPLLDARTFVRILRTNPRTERIPVVLTGESPDIDRTRLGTFLKKPFNQDEVLARVEQIFRRIDAARAVAAGSRDIEGNLAQIPLVDLLQILAVNRKTGVLHLEREGDKAEILLADGRIVDARVATIAGEKALYRLLTLREGQFAFVPAKVIATQRVERKLEELILEGLRQADEVARLLPTLPHKDDRLELCVAKSDIPPGLHPVTEGVVSVLERPATFAEILDRSGASDLEVMRAVLALQERGYVRRASAEPAKQKGAELLAPQDLHALRTRISRGRASGPQTVGKVIVVGGGPLSRRSAWARFESLPGFAPERQRGGGFGTLGRLTLDGGLRVDLCEIPGEPSHRPLWRPFAAGAVGALVLLPAEGLDLFLEEITRVLRLPTVICGPSREAIPEVLRSAPRGVVFCGSDAAEGLRALLAGAGGARPAI